MLWLVDSDWSKDYVEAKDILAAVAKYTKDAKKDCPKDCLDDIAVKEVERVALRVIR